MAMKSRNERNTVLSIPNTYTHTLQIGDESIDQYIIFF